MKKINFTRILLATAVAGEILLLSTNPKVPVKQVNKAKVRIFGQYVQFNQPNINWKEVADGVKKAGYNGYYVHGMSPWGAYKTSMPFMYSNSSRKYDLTKHNPVYRSNVRRFLSEVCGEADITCGAALFDFYYQAKSAYRTSVNPHPFRDNKQNIDWSNDVLSLGESKPWFTHVSWVTQGHSFDEKVISYNIKPRYRWLWNYINLWGQEIKRASTAYPGMEPVLVRYNNESFTRYDKDGRKVHSEGGEDKLYQIVRLEWERIGLKHGRDFIIVNDWMPIEGAATFLAEDWAKAGRFDRHPNHKWMREVHGVNPARLLLLQELSRKYPQWASHTFTIYSTDSVKPEDATFITKSRELYCSSAKWVDLKVPSELSPYHNLNYMKTFRAVLPVMRRIATCN